MPGIAIPPVRVALVNLWHPPGLDPAGILAADPLRRELGRLLAQRGHEVHVVQEHAETTTRCDGAVTWHFVRPSIVARVARSALAHRTDAMVKAPATHLLPALRSLSPDLIHSFDLSFYPTLALLGRFARARRIPLVAHFHGGAPARTAGLRALERYALARTDRLLFTSRERGLDWVRSGALADPSRIVEVFETSTLFEPGPAPRLPGHPAILHAGRLDAVKDPLTVLAGFRAALPRLPDAHLTMAFTDAPLLPAVAVAARGLPVTLRGRVPVAEMEALHRGADRFVQASVREVCSVAVLEAIAVGTPVILSDIPPFARLTDGGRVGRLFPVGDAAALAEALVAPAPDRATVRAWFERSLSFAALAETVEAVYLAAR